MTTFKQLGLSDKVLKALTDLGFETPSEIQAEAIPQLMEGDRDFIGLAQTGTGKTAAFGLPLLERIDTNKSHTQALVLAPTRELGQQIAEQLAKFSKYMDKVNVLPVYGGAPISHQIKDLRRTQHVIIATPGRLIDLIKRKAVKLDKLKYLVLDEADEMLNMGFKEELDEILSYAPEEKVTWLFSATMPSFIKKIVKKYMDDPIEVRINTENKVNENIEHQFAVVKASNKKEALTRFIDLNADLRGLVFCRTKRDTQELAEHLMGMNYHADALHGDLSQAQRDRVMKRFKKHDLQLLIATDVAARGIDVNDLTHVFHFTLPDDQAYYTHRSGRTARAGKKGISMAFVNGREKGKLNRLERDLKISFAQKMVPDAEDISNIRIHNWATNILEHDSKKKADKKLLGKVNLLFANLSKEEIIAKLLDIEIEKLNLNTSRNLNEALQKGGDRSDRGDRRGRGGDRRRGDGRFGGRGRDRREGGRGDKRDGRGGEKREGRGGEKREGRGGDMKEGREEGRSSKKERGPRGRDASDKNGRGKSGSPGGKKRRFHKSK